MKGIVFTEFMEMVEQNWDMDIVDDLIDAVDPASGGSYTSVGTYEFDELVAYVVELNKKTNIEIKDLIYTFGTYLANSFVNKFPEFFSEASCTFDVLKKVDDHIHVEVRKLYPDAELPKFSYEELPGNQLKLIYESSRNLPDLAHGLIDGCAKHFKEELHVSRTNCSEGEVAKEEFLISVN